jgi:glycerol-3-phosphate dehydrogenase
MVQAPELSFRTRQKNLQTLEREQFDILIIGGGITGAGVARDAALRGLSVALVEARDFAAGTSSRSSKLVHGGLRYLQQRDFALVREAATERYVLRKLAPHLARPAQMLVPVHSRRGYAAIKAGLWTYDRIARVAEAERYRMLSREEACEIEPLLQTERLYGAGLYYEYLTDDARLVLEVIKSAAALGAVVVNRAEAKRFLVESGVVNGAVVHDHVAGADIEVRGGVVINAAGPWVDAVRLLSENGEKPRLRLTKGIHVAVRSDRLPLSRIVVMNARDRRGVFAIPKDDVTYLGTTDTDYPRPEAYPRIDAEDVLYLLEAANRTFTVDGLTVSDVVSAWAGLRPLLQQEGKKPSELSRKDEIMVSPNGLLSIAGGKLTTFRRMAERIIEMACRGLMEQGRPAAAPLGESECSMLSGGDTGDDIAAYASELTRRSAGTDPAIVERLTHLYGSNAEQIVAAITADPRSGEPYAPGSLITPAEVEYAVRSEMALTLEDMLERRTRLLLWEPDNGLSVAAGVALTMASLLRWSDERLRTELSAYRELVARSKRFWNEGSADQIARAAHG